MTMTQNDLRRKLQYILHLGFVDVRNLALVEGCEQQIFDLADAMEILPSCIEKDDWELARFVLQNYKKQYPNSRYDYVAYLDRDDLPNYY